MNKGLKSLAAVESRAGLSGERVTWVLERRLRGEAVEGHVAVKREEEEGRWILTTNDSVQ